MTLEGVAEILGCTKAQISKLERGHIRLNDEWLDGLSAVFCCSVHELIDDDDPAAYISESVNDDIKRDFVTARMVGYVNSHQIGFIEYLPPEKQYPLNFSPPASLKNLPSSHIRYTGLTVLGDAFPAFPEGSQLIFATVDDETACLLKENSVVLCSFKDDRCNEQHEAVRVIEYDALGVPYAVFKLRKSRQSLLTLSSDMLLGELSVTKQLSVVAEAEANQPYKKLPKKEISIANKSLNIKALLVKAIVDRV